MNNEQKIQELERKVEELTKKVSDLYLLGNLPIDVENNFIQRGFLRQDKRVTYEGGASGNTFTAITVRYKEQNDLISIGNKLTIFSVNTTSNVCYATNHEFSDGQTVFFYTTGSLPGGLDSPVLTYSIINSTSDTFQIDNGSGVTDITTTGSGANYIQPY